MKKWILTCLLGRAIALLATPSWAIESADEGWQGGDLVCIYSHNSELQRQWACQGLALYPFRGDERVLDFGCGDGKISAQMAFSSREVVGVDLSQSMVDFASAMFADERYSSLHFESISEPSFATWQGEPFDLITSFSVFHVIPDASATIANLRRHLKPKGHLLLVYPAGASSEFFQAAREEFARWGWTMPSHPPQDLNMRILDEARQIFERDGWSLCHLSLHHTRTVFASETELIDWCEGTVSPNWAIPAEHRRAFMVSFVARFLELSPDCRNSDGTVVLPFKHINVLATPQ